MYINIICFYRAEPSMINYLQLRWHFNLEMLCEKKTFAQNICI